MWPGFGAGWLLLALVVVLTGLVAAAVAVAAAGREPAGGAAPAAAVLAERLARGEISVEEYQQRRAVLGQPRPAGHAQAWLWVLAAAAAVLLLLAAVLAAGMWRSQFWPGGWMPMHRAAAPACTPAELPGPVVTVALADTGSMPGPMPGRPGPWAGPGTMSATVDPASVPAGSVSVRAVNAGHLVHELIVLPLPAGQPTGSRPPAEDGTVPEDDALAEAEAECAGSTGHLLAPGGSGSASVDLAAGRYELICNLPGHYARGMRTVLEVR